MRVKGITHVALELSWPTRMEDYLRDAFGLQTLQHGYWKGDYIRIMGSPDPELKNPGFLVLFLRTGIPEGRLRHVAFGIEDLDVPGSVEDLRGRGVYVDVDGGDILYAPEDLLIKLDSFTNPRPWDYDDPNVKMEDCPVDPNLPCMVRGIHHLSFELAAPTRMRDWMEEMFGLDRKRRFHRRGEYWHGIGYSDAEKDPSGRPNSLLAIPQRPGLARVHLHHIAFDVDDMEQALGTLKTRGFEVPQTDRIMFGPEKVWIQIDSRETPFPRDHPRMQGGFVRLKEEEWPDLKK